MLEVVGYIALGLVAAAALLLGLAALPLYSKETPLDVAVAIEEFLESGRGDREWDEFLGIRAKDASVNALKAQLRQIDDAHRTDEPPHYLAAEGLSAIRALAASIRASAA